MPEVVECEAVVGRPVVLARGEQIDAFVDAPLHLHHVRDGVHGPAVLRLDVERAARGRLGLGVLVHLLEPEGVHAEHVGVSGRGGVPVRQHARHAVAQVERVAAVEVHEVRRPAARARRADGRRARGRARGTRHASRRRRSTGRRAAGRARGRWRPFRGATLRRPMRDRGHQRLLARGEHRERAEEVARDEVGRVRRARHRAWRRDRRRRTGTGAARLRTGRARTRSRR